MQVKLIISFSHHCHKIVKKFMKGNETKYNAHICRGRIYDGEKRFCLADETMSQAQPV